MEEVFKRRLVIGSFKTTGQYDPDIEGVNIQTIMNN